ncbi:MAG: choice-of-anchor B family protein [Rhodothermales bacterium]|nr:choice-of-anchor B family protein [Rhodothermales bacterium]
MTRRILFFAGLMGLAAATAFGQGRPTMGRIDATGTPGLQGITALTPCVSGDAGGFACDAVDLLAFVPASTFGAGSLNDIWGWTDPQDGSEYALVGLNNGTAFVDVTDPENPVYLGKLPTHTSSSSWRDVKVYADHAFIVSEASGHGMQVFDLTELRNVPSPPVTFAETAFYGNVSRVHNIVINEATGFAYTVGNNGGGTTCAGGLHMIDISVPTSPTFAGCYSGDGYTHDAQCVVYDGPDVAHQGKEICFNSNEDTLTIVDVTNKANPVMLGKNGYPGASYVHQGWLTDAHDYFYLDDELDAGATRTLIWDVSDLDDPQMTTEYVAATTSRDHNQYVDGDLLYQANYTTGLRVLDISDRLNPIEVGFFDTYTPNNGTSFSGAWSNYPYFASGTVVVSSIGEGLFVLQPAATPPPAAFTITLKKVFINTNGQGVAKIKWTATDVSTGKVDVYVDGAKVGKTKNDGKTKVKFANPGGGPFAIHFCEKGTTTVCSNAVMADFTGAVAEHDDEADEADDVEVGRAAGRSAEAAPAVAGGLAAEQPEGVVRAEIFPNPFHTSATVRVAPAAAQPVRVSVVDLLGRRVALLHDGPLAAAPHTFTLDAEGLPSGTYLLRIEGAAFTETRVLTLAR